MPSLYSSNSDGTETPTALPCLIETPTPRIWGPIDSPVADVTNITSTSCDVSWNYQDNAVFYITSCIQMFSDVNDPQITRHSNETTKVGSVTSQIYYTFLPNDFAVFVQFEE